MTERPPMPLEWHPAYRDQTWLLDWLDGKTSYPPDYLRVPFYKRLSIAEIATEDLYPTGPSASTHTLTRHRCGGPAPYVGRPFLYTWWAATDELGRGIAADSTIQYRTDPLDDFRDWGPEPFSLPLYEDFRR